MSQPSLPVGLTANHKRDPGLSEAELKIVEQRAVNEGLCAMGLRFSEDRVSPWAFRLSEAGWSRRARFKALKGPDPRGARGGRDQLEAGQHIGFRKNGP